VRIVLMIVGALALTAAGASASPFIEASDHARGWQRFVDLELPVYCGAGRQPLVALTFDDGPGPGTEALVQALGELDAEATFFDIGVFAARHPERVRLQRTVGSVGVHSWSHVYLPRQPRAVIWTELAATRSTLERALGEPVALYRPPFGAYDDVVVSIGRELGLVDVLWSVNSEDVSTDVTDPHAIAEFVLARARPGSIVLLHEQGVAYARTIAAVRLFVPELQRRGLTLVTVDELLTDDPPSDRQLRSGTGACD
jgi:peptidoglycan-N-acetylglucosamine deacetylase